MVVSIAEGTRAQIQRSVEGLGANRIDVNSGTLSGTRNALLPFGGIYQLRDGDVDAVRDVRGVSAASGMLRGSAKVSASGTEVVSTWVGAGSGALDVMGYSVERGRALSSHDLDGVKRIVLLGDTVAQRLFVKSSAVGGRVRMSGSTFLVAGVLSKRGLTVSGQDLDDVVILPLSAARRNLMGDFPLPHRAVQQIGIRVSDVDRIPEIERAIRKRLREGRGLLPSQMEDFYVASVAATVETKSQTDRSMAYLLLAVGTICLLVGGIGVMNTMLVSISERVGEIGLRMALGASAQHIRLQFLVESMLISFSGGLIGVVLGVIGSMVVAAQQGISVELNMFVILSGFAITVITGIAFGLLPADRAARLRPVEALRKL